ncbi:MAG: DNA gyrase/topoisomerase IV subunit A, partial [Muribaculaceae bacterium]
HYEDNILRIEKYRPGHVWTAILNDADQGGYPYLKRFKFESTSRKQRWLGESEKSTLVLLTDEPGARFLVTFGEADTFREPMEVSAHDFVGVKSFKAKGKRLTTWTIDHIEELEPEAVDDAIDSIETDESETSDETNAEPDKSDDEVRDEILGQQRIF